VLVTPTMKTPPATIAASLNEQATEWHTRHPTGPRCRMKSVLLGELDLQDVVNVVRGTAAVRMRGTSGGRDRMRRAGEIAIR